MQLRFGDKREVRLSSCVSTQIVGVIYVPSFIYVMDLPYEIDDPVKLIQAKAQIDTMMQQLDPTRNSYQKLEFFKICVRTILAQMGQITLTYLNILRRRPEAVEACTCMYLVRAQT